MTFQSWLSSGDRIYMDASWLEHDFTPIDTGGTEIKSADKILTEIRTQAKIAVDEADTIIFVVDERGGLTVDGSEKIIGTSLRRPDFFRYCVSLSSH